MMVMCVRSYLLETEIWIFFGFTACGPLGATGSVMLRGWGQTLIAAYSTFFHSPTPGSDALVGLAASPSSPYVNITSEPTHNSCEVRTIVSKGIFSPSYSPTLLPSLLRGSVEENKCLRRLSTLFD